MGGRLWRIRSSEGEFTDIGIRCNSTGAWVGSGATTQGHGWDQGQQHRGMGGIRGNKGSTGGLDICQDLSQRHGRSQRHLKPGAAGATQGAHGWHTWPDAEG